CPGAPLQPGRADGAGHRRHLGDALEPPAVAGGASERVFVTARGACLPSDARRADPVEADTEPGRQTGRRGAGEQEGVTPSMVPLAITQLSPILMAAARTTTTAAKHP